MSQNIFVFFLYIIYLFNLINAAEESPQESSQESEEEIKYVYAPKWTIEGEEFEQILNSKSGERYESNTFNVGNATWKMLSYPNGNNEESIGSYMIFAYLQDMPQNYKEIIILLTIWSPQTNSRLKRIAIYKESKGLGWYPNTLKLNEIKEKNLESLEWMVSIQILRIIDINDKIIYEKPLLWNLEHHIKWNVNDKMYEQMKSSYIGKAFQSSKNEMWSLRVYPNGRDEGFTDMYLTLCGLPYNIYKITVKYTLKCIETNTSSTHIKDFSYSEPVWSWNKQVLSFELFKNQKNITFEADIEILDLYDINDNKIVFVQHIEQLKSTIKQLRENITNNDEQCDDDAQDIKNKYDELQIKYKKLKDEQAKINDKFVKDIALLRNQLGSIKTEQERK